MSCGGCALFQDVMVCNGLKDLGLKDMNFTWSRGDTFEQLDSAICNEIWSRFNPDTLVFQLLKIKSDHRPILIEIGNRDNKKDELPFRFFVGWLSHQSFTNLVRNEWVASNCLPDTIAYFIEKVKLWNKKTFGNIFATRKHVLGRLKGV
ncbi:uncharacterized protein [Gossypium hirsutum]|uniref:Reverse transcriptase n=1 Tax=Gossypium hirsutum TaxID=3635 RepID=A0ABM3A5F0_GOSHI|nr:uncharacterized protein LOC121217802 [Gossypium hirsutum]